MPCFLFLLLTGGILVFNLILVDYIDGLTVMINDQAVAIVKNKNDVEIRLSLLERQIESDKKIDIVFDKQLLSFEPSEATLNQFSSVALLDKRLNENMTYRCKVWALKVNGKNVVFLRTKEEIEELIDILNRYYIPNARSDEKIENLSVRIVETLEIQSDLAYFDSIKNRDEAFNYLLWGSEQREVYRVQPGDTFYYISKKNNVNYNDLIEANAHLNPQSLKVGDEVYLSVKKPFINVEVGYRHIYDQVIIPPVITLLDNSMIRTQIAVDAEGEPGKKRVYAEKVLINEYEKNVTILREEILKEPRVRILRLGTQRTPDDILVAQAFLAPGIGVISDYFGSPRWGGRRHIGIDIAIAENTPVYAYKAGVVKLAGWSEAGYGNLVAIDHGDGLETYYAHNNSIAVKVGQRVEKGELISLSGNTGVSTGTHVHFEVRINNAPVDPLWYLKTH